MRLAKTPANRALEIARVLRPVLEEGEYALIMGRDLNAMILIPSDLQSRLEEGGKLTTQDTAPAITMLLAMLVKASRDHLATIYGKEAADRVLQGPSVLGPDGQPAKA